MIVNRDYEKEKLLQLSVSERPELVLLVGRRRVGKTWLLSHLWPAHQAFFFTASQTTPEINRVQLIEDFNRWAGDILEPSDYPTWRTLFRELLARAEHTPTIIILDEFQYLAENGKGLSQIASELNAVWERFTPMHPLLLILSGSEISMMEGLNQGGSPLYGRFTSTMHLEPFTYDYAGELSGFTSLRDQALAYGIFGGTPRYLAAIDAERSLAENVAELFLHPHGEVRQLVETALMQEAGLRDVVPYNAILSAVGKGKTQRNEIAQAIGVSNDFGLRDKLDRLISLGYIREKSNFTVRKNAPVLYELSDPAQRFYQMFVEPNRSYLARSRPLQAWNELVEPRLSTYMGLIFEQFLPQAWERIFVPQGLPSVREWSRFEGQDKHRNPVEIDIVAPFMDGNMLTGAVKWNEKPIELEMLLTGHIKSLERLGDGGLKWAKQALSKNSYVVVVSASGYSAPFNPTSHISSIVQQVSLIDLYSP